MFNQSTVQSVLMTFKQVFIGCEMRFGRTKKIPHEFKGIIYDISWSESKRKGGGFTIWIYYNGLTRPHNIVLKQMVSDYIKTVEELKNQGMKLNSIRNKTTNASKDCEILFNNKWYPLDKVFPITVRELKNDRFCQIWTRKYTNNSKSSLFLDLLYQEYKVMTKPY